MVVAESELRVPEERDSTRLRVPASQTSKETVDVRVMTDQWLRKGPMTTERSLFEEHTGEHSRSILTIE